MGRLQCPNFEILRASLIAVKIATTFLDLPLIKMTVAGVVGESVTGRIQCIVRRENSKYVLVFRLVIAKPENADDRDVTDKPLGEASPKWKRDRGGYCALSAGVG
ncbi:uncharacterized protein ATNIH1004_004385 [Aspergillus tanneri]|uniref:Uncharacterized protein n=1 Tax=Aspergillus tanneri TaxID=1220188 RepID=A0A5M9MT28_9EURO|nr:uncharacterized protein ATNIH1004_004385 [Aspergillus tanneri]KAA8648500.1 hypothetical protein ATNIH1004_004385 [Aspergillus tanneri]